MLLSMTGYGSSTVTYDNSQYLLELYSVNRKGVDFTIHLPSANLWLENELRKFLSSHIKRGQVILKLSLIQGSNSEIFDVAQFTKVSSAFIKLEQGVKSDKAFSLDFIFEQAQKMKMNASHGKDSGYFDVLLVGLNKAFDEWMQMKRFEGQSLKKDFLQRIHVFSDALGEIKKFSEKTRLTIADKIKAVAKSHGILEGLEKDRFYAEIAFYCDKYDIHEECIRLASHIENIKDWLSGKNCAGARSIEFILQEMMRETNTLCSKSPLSEVKKHGVLIKVEIEKFREQLQNLE